MKLTLFFILGLFAYCEGAELCAQRIFDCAEFKAIGFTAGFHLHEKETKLRGVCEILAPYRSCIDATLKTCLEEDLMNPIIKQMLETRLIPYMVCDGTVWRKLYLEEAPCINKFVSSSLLQCEKESIYFADKAEKLDYPQVCKNLSGVILCQEKIMFEKCGYRASELYKRITMFKNPLAFICHKYMKQQLEEDTAKPRDMRSDYSVSVDMLRYIIPQAYYYVITQDPNIGTEFYSMGKGTKSEQEEPNVKIQEDQRFIEDLEIEPDDIFAVRLDNVLLKSVLDPDGHDDIKQAKLLKDVFGEEVINDDERFEDEHPQGKVPRGWMLEKERFQKFVVKLPTFSPTFETSDTKLLRNHIQSQVKKTTEAVREVWNEWKRSQLLTETSDDPTMVHLTRDNVQSKAKQNVPHSGDDSSGESHQERRTGKDSAKSNEKYETKNDPSSKDETEKSTSRNENNQGERPPANDKLNALGDGKESDNSADIMSEWTRSRLVTGSANVPQRQFNVYLRHNLQKEQAALRKAAIKEEKTAKSEIPLSPFVPFSKNSTFTLYHVVYGIDRYVGCGLGEFTWSKHRVSFKNLLCGWATEESSSAIFDCSVYFGRKCSFSPFRRDYVVGKDLAGMALFIFEPPTLDNFSPQKVGKGDLKFYQPLPYLQPKVKIL